MEFFVTLTLLGSVFFMIMSHATPLPKNISEEKGQFGDFFEGDMVLSEAQLAMIENAKNDDNVESRNGLVTIAARWPGKTVVYRINAESLDNDKIQKIRNAMSDIEKQSCIKFRETKSNEHAVTIQGLDPKGCYSNLGYRGRQKQKNQILNLGSGCFAHGTIIHEMLHVLGFVHMQSTYNRDDFVTIVFKNIKKGKEKNFDKFPSSIVTNFGVPYDYGSVMHYSRKAFSKNGEDTIVPKKATNAQLGQTQGLSAGDVMKLKIMYKC